MDHYIDVKINPDAEMRENVLLNKVYAKFHKALWTMKATDVGVSFPLFKVKLGRLLRIHGDKGKLTELENLNWLGGLVGYCDVSQVQPVPTAGIRYRVVSRKQTNMSPAKLRRLIKRGTISEKEAKGYKAKMFQQGLSNPYLELTSGSNGQKHRRYISFGELCDTPQKGLFDDFGLSKNGTIPWF